MTGSADLCGWLNGRYNSRECFLNDRGASMRRMLNPTELANTRRKLSRLEAL
jgi:hypothetical protein